MSADVAPVWVGAEDAIELGELLEFVGDWLAGASDVVADAFAGFVGGGYTVEELRADLGRFALLLGADAERFVVEDRR